ncbi:ABC transporter permease [Isoptericola croceus]|uniref:ABC transporter permease n=1 Tax=Isoptericola croceus TaxID=3031406 RepID=UPI0023F9C609|nr:ABC transporter permease [Isoptericola croceus]
MLKFILRRLGISVLVLWLASVLIYWLVTISGDPLQDLRESNADNAAQLMQARIDLMNLDQPWYQRYWDWLQGVTGCFTGSCDLGKNIHGADVLVLTSLAAGSTLRLVTLATLLAIVVGVALGILTAIRQYSGFDYAVTFLAFLFFSLPVFWAAVLLKEFGAIRFNDWIASGDMEPPMVLAIAVIGAVLVAAVLGGPWRRRLYTAAGTFAFATVVLYVLNIFEWYRNPFFGLGMVLLTATGAAVLTTGVVAGLGNRRVLYGAVTTAVVGTVSYLLVANLLLEPSSWWVLVGLFALAVAVSVGVGAAWGGFARKQAMLVSAITGILTSLVIVFDILVANWSSFLQLKPRPISTIGSQTPNFTGDFWESVLDTGMQLVLPTILLTLISVASYSRYTRSSMLETMNQDYVRTARSKGLSERAVITKHAFRNALIPITTIVAFDFASLIGGAVITERVFGWKGMGALFIDALNAVDPAPVMAFFLVTGVAAIVMNMLADIAYAFLDPRIRR